MSFPVQYILWRPRYLKNPGRRGNKPRQHKSLLPYRQYVNLKVFSYANPQAVWNFSLSPTKRDEVYLSTEGKALATTPSIVIASGVRDRIYMPELSPPAPATCFSPGSTIPLSGFSRKWFSAEIGAQPPKNNATPPHAHPKSFGRSESHIVFAQPAFLLIVWGSARD